MKKSLIILFLFITILVLSSHTAFALNCIDSDSGQNKYARGTTVQTNPPSSKTDFCLSSSYVFEYYCNPTTDMLATAHLYCPSASPCSNGACSSSSTNTITPQTNQTNTSSSSIPPSPSSTNTSISIPNIPLPDLVVRDISTELSQQVYSGRRRPIVTITLANEGDKAVPTYAGHTTLFVDGILQQDFIWSRLSNTAFMSVGGVTTLKPYVLEDGQHTVKVCVDSDNIVQESHEDNNCLGKQFVVSSIDATATQNVVNEQSEPNNIDQDTVYPSEEGEIVSFIFHENPIDLIVDDFYTIKRMSDIYLVVRLRNTLGNSDTIPFSHSNDPTTYLPSMSLTTDGFLRKNFPPLNMNFINDNKDKIISDCDNTFCTITSRHPNNIFSGKNKAVVCVDTSNYYAENDEINNCLEKSIIRSSIPENLDEEELSPSLSSISKSAEQQSPQPLENGQVYVYNSLEQPIPQDLQSDLKVSDSSSSVVTPSTIKSSSPDVGFISFFRRLYNWFLGFFKPQYVPVDIVVVNNQQETSEDAVSDEPIIIVENDNEVQEVPAEEGTLEGCDLIPDKLNSCTPFSCIFKHPFGGLMMERNIVGLSGDLCVYTEQTPGNGLLTCNYTEDFRTAIAQYYRDMAASTSSGFSVRVSPDDIATMYTINGKEVSNPLQEAMNTGVCKITVQR